MVKIKNKPKQKNRKICTIYTKSASFFLFYIFKHFGFEPIYLDGPCEKELPNVSKNISAEWCFILKVIAADLYKGLKEGADVVVGPTNGMFTFLGPCKMSYIMEYKMETVLKKSIDKDFQYVVFHFPQPATFASIVDMLSKLGINMKNPLNLIKCRQLYKKGLRRGYEAYKLENILRKVRPRVENQQVPIAILNDAMKKMRKIYNEKEWMEHCRKTKKRLLSIPQNKKIKTLRIGITGDYLTVIGVFPQFDIENFLSKKFNVEIVQQYSLCNEIAEFEKCDYSRLRKKYSKYWVGGTDMATIESIFHYRDLKVDGIIQLKTFGCIPEDMATLMIEEIKEKEKNIPPVLTLTFDEHSSAEGLKTRLEAFCNTLILSKQ